MDWYLGSTRNGVKDLECDPKVVCNDNVNDIEAVVSRGRGPDIHDYLVIYYHDFYFPAL